MITSEQALNYQFQKAGMNGYRALEVDKFITEVSDTLGFQERKMRDMQRIIDDLKKNETIIQTTLVNAQKLAMQLTDDARKEADAKIAAATEEAATIKNTAQAESDRLTAESTAKAKALLSEAQQKAAEITATAATAAKEKLSAAQQRANGLITVARNSAERITAETAAEQAREQKILDALMTEVATFRSSVLNMYVKQVALVKDLPSKFPEKPVYVNDEVGMDEKLPDADIVDEPTSAEEELSEKIEAADAGVASEEPNEAAGIESTDAEQNDAEHAEDEQVEEPVSDNLIKIFDEMKDNEQKAADAVDEVANLTENDEEDSAAAVIAEAEMSELSPDDADEAQSEEDNADEASADTNDSAKQETADEKTETPLHVGGFNIIIDDDDEDEETSDLLPIDKD